MATAKHTTDQRAFIIQRLVRKQSPETIAKEFAAKFKPVPCTVDDVLACDRPKLDAAWQAYFDEQRALYLDAPAAAQEFRLAMLSETALLAKDRNALNEMFRALEMIAKEQGVGAYGKTGAPAKGAEAPGDLGPVTTITRTVVYPAATTAPAPEAT